MQYDNLHIARWALSLMLTFLRSQSARPEWTWMLSKQRSDLTRWSGRRTKKISLLKEGRGTLKIQIQNISDQDSELQTSQSSKWWEVWKTSHQIQGQRIFSSMLQPVFRESNQIRSVRKSKIFWRSLWSEYLYCISFKGKPVVSFPMQGSFCIFQSNFCLHHLK